MRGAILWVSLLCSVAAWGQAPSPGGVALSLTPASPVKGRDTAATLELTIAGVERPPPPVLRANVGSIEQLERTGPGTFRARYRLPTTRFPEVAIIVAFAPWPHPQSVEGRFAVLRVPIASAVEVPGRAEPGAVVRLMVGNKSFGPVSAQADGTFRLPVVIPPGYGLAKTLTVDRVGNKRTSPLDLMLPPTDQLACVVTPTLLPADGVSRARVLCASSDRYGAPSRGAKVVWKGGHGSWSPARELGDGVQEWTWTAPRELGSGSEQLTASWKSGPVDSTETITVALSQGPVSSLTVTPLDELAHVASPWRATVTARDALGRPLAGVRVQGEGIPPVLTEQSGRAIVTWQARPPKGRRELSLRASGPFGREPARLVASQRTGGVLVTVTDLAGLPVPGERLLLGQQEYVTSVEGTAELPATGEVVHAEWPGLRLQLGTAPLAPPPFVTASAEVQVGPALPVNVKVAPVDGGVEWWVEAADGSILDDRPVELVDRRGARQVVSRGKTRLDAPDALTTITDLRTNVSAVVEGAR